MNNPTLLAPNNVLRWSWWHWQIHCTLNSDMYFLHTTFVTPLLEPHSALKSGTPVLVSVPSGPHTQIFVWHCLAIPTNCCLDPCVWFFFFFLSFLKCCYVSPYNKQRTNQFISVWKRERFWNTSPKKHYAIMRATCVRFSFRVATVPLQTALCSELPFGRHLETWVRGFSYQVTSTKSYMQQHEVL